MITDRRAKGMFCPINKANCLGSKCMAWHWASPEEMGEAMRAQIERDNDTSVGPETCMDDWRASGLKPYGYCGLIKKPDVVND